MALTAGADGGTFGSPRQFQTTRRASVTRRASKTSNVLQVNNLRFSHCLTRGSSQSMIRNAKAITEQIQQKDEQIRLIEEELPSARQQLESCWATAHDYELLVGVLEGAAQLLSEGADRVVETKATLEADLLKAQKMLEQCMADVEDMDDKMTESQRVLEAMRGERRELLEKIEKCNAAATHILGRCSAALQVPSADAALESLPRADTFLDLSAAAMVAETVKQRVGHDGG